MAVEVRIPSLGESVSEGVISRWLKENGDVVATDDVLLELETDKATMEIPAEAAGRLEILKQAGETVEVGTVVARIANGASAGAAKAKPAAPAPEAQKAPEATPAKAEAPKPAPAAPAAQTESEAPLSPAVRKLLAENDIEPEEVKGTGKGGRVTKEDVLRVIEGGKKGPPAAAAKPEAPREAEPSAPARRAPTQPAAAGDDVERVSMTRLRKRIAERLVEA